MDNKKKIIDDENKKVMTKLVIQELNDDPYNKFKLAFALMSVIPLLTFTYIFLNVLSKIYSFSIISIIIYILVFISILGFCIGYGVVKKLLNNIMLYLSKVKRSEQLQAELAASISHDFRIPISILKEALGSIQAGNVGQISEVQKSRLDSCQSTLDNMYRTIDTLLDLYKIKCGMVELKKETHDIGALIEEKLKECEPVFNKQNIKISRKLGIKDLSTQIDVSKIREVINNILSNALRYTPHSGEINLSVNPVDNFIRIEFMNNGTSIPPDQLAVIFNKFKKLDDAKSGTGLGLAIAKDIVELHGGDIWAENIPEKGVRFVIVLPRSS
ncbi:MAG TPA: HAMP domain-containing sensor histidine kinase [Candidatus Omnitrophota bacterium]|nr:HAMP domain-containing sensor histidine kinase [Candidatus Omnitrophota bacterium]